MDDLRDELPPDTPNTTFCIQHMAVPIARLRGQSAVLAVALERLAERPAGDAEAANLAAGTAELARHLDRRAAILQTCLDQIENAFERDTRPRI